LNNLTVRDNQRSFYDLKQNNLYIEVFKSQNNVKVLKTLKIFGIMNSIV